MPQPANEKDRWNVGASAKHVGPYPANAQEKTASRNNAEPAVCRFACLSTPEDITFP
jgi:hypothetical protein